MTMRGIDIASYQAGIDITGLPLDFVIVKATQGTGYTNPDCARAVDQALAAGIAVGVYHYIDGSDATAEADHFIDQITGWLGRVLICLDWESGSNTAWGDTSYLARVIDRVRERAGRPPVVYASASAFPWQTCTDRDCPAWVAQYADMNPTGHQDHPWNEDAYTCLIRQYSATGRLDGWAGDLDLDIFYGDRALWDAHTTNEGADMQLTDTITRPDGHQASVGDILAWLDQRIEALYNITRPDGKTVDLATIAAYNDQRLERLEAALIGGGLTVKNPDGTDTDRDTDIATEARWLPANILRVLEALGAGQDKLDAIKAAISTGGSGIQPTGSTAEAGTVPASGLDPSIHIVTAGETLRQIAERAGVDMQTIIDANPGLDPNGLVAGQRITIPTSTSQEAPHE